MRKWITVAEQMPDEAFRVWWYKVRIMMGWVCHNPREHDFCTVENTEIVFAGAEVVE